MFCERALPFELAIEVAFSKPTEFSTEAVLLIKKIEIFSAFLKASFTVLLLGKGRGCVKHITVGKRASWPFPVISGIQSY